MKFKMIFTAVALAAVLYLQFCVDFKKMIPVEPEATAPQATTPIPDPGTTAPDTATTPEVAPAPAPAPEGAN